MRQGSHGRPADQAKSLNYMRQAVEDVGTSRVTILQWHGMGGPACRSPFEGEKKVLCGCTGNSMDRRQHKVTRKFVKVIVTA